MYAIKQDAVSVFSTDGTPNPERLHLVVADPSVAPVYRSFKFRLFTTAKQENALTVMLDAFCDLYNAGLQQRIEAYRRRGISLHYYDQAYELKAVRAVDERLASYSFSAEQEVLRRLNKTFSAFFGRIKRGEKTGYPRFRSKSRYSSANFRVGDGLTIRKNRRIGIVGIPGDIKIRQHRGLPSGAKIRAAVIRRLCGKWYVYFQIMLANAKPPNREFAPIGIDLGLINLVALSSGETVPTPQYMRHAAKQERRLQRALCRCKRGSKRRWKAKVRLGRHVTKTASQRQDGLHKLSRSLVDRFSHIAMEGLNVAGMAAGMLAKPIHNAAWGKFIQYVIYKAVNAGSAVVLVDPCGTSQTCPECGTVKHKALAERTHCCECGCTLDRDVAAAKIVLLRANFRSGTGLQTPNQRVAA